MAVVFFYRFGVDSADFAGLSLAQGTDKALTRHALNELFRAVGA